MGKLDSSNWTRYAVIAHLARRLRSGSKFGRTALQKLMFILQHVHGVPLGYNFKFYNYGPYSSTLAGDLDYANLIQAVRVSYDPDFNFYNIREGSNSKEMEKRGFDFLKKHQHEINQVIEAFGKKSAKELELISTIFFFFTHMSNKKEISLSRLQREILKLKPRFSG